MKDIMGKSVEVGSLIAWPNRQSSSCWINVGKVIKLSEHEGWCYTGDGAGGAKMLPRIHVELVKSSDGWLKPGRKTYIDRTDRVVVVG